MALGAVAGLFGIDVEAFVAGLHHKFRKKKGVGEQAEAAFRAGVDYVREDNIVKLDSMTFDIGEGLAKKDFK